MLKALSEYYDLIIALGGGILIARLHLILTIYLTISSVLTHVVKLHIFVFKGFRNGSSAKRHWITSAAVGLLVGLSILLLTSCAAPKVYQSSIASDSIDHKPENNEPSNLEVYTDQTVLQQVLLITDQSNACKNHYIAMHYALAKSNGEVTLLMMYFIELDDVDPDEGNNALRNLITLRMAYQECIKVNKQLGVKTEFFL